MAMFVELESGAIINLDHVVTMSPQRLNRLEFIAGGHIQLSEADGEKIRTLMRESSKPPQTHVALDTSLDTKIAEPHIDTPHVANLGTAPKPKRRRGRPKKYVEPEQ